MTQTQALQFLKVLRGHSAYDGLRVASAWIAGIGYVICAGAVLVGMASNALVLVPFGLLGALGIGVTRGLTVLAADLADLQLFQVLAAHSSNPSPAVPAIPDTNEIVAASAATEQETLKPWQM